MKVGDRVKYIELPNESFIIVDAQIGNFGTGSRWFDTYEIKKIEDPSSKRWAFLDGYEVFENEITMDVEYYRDLKLKDLLDENRG